LGAGSVIHAMHHEQDLTKMGGLRKYLPITHITFLIGTLAISGIPPFAGFFSKDEILTAALQKNPIYYVLGVVTSLMTAFYMFRLYFLTFSGNFRGTDHQAKHLHESPFAMTLPLMVLALLSIVGGFVGIPSVFAENAHVLSAFLDPVLGSAPSPSHAAVHLSHSTELMLMGVVVFLIILMIFFASRKFVDYKESEKEESAISKFLANKWYVDELYETIIVKPLGHLASFFNKVIDAKIIDGFVNGVGRSVQYSARQLRLLQSGQVGSYVLIMVISIILLFIFQFFWKH
jgi:NADH-quinone oxidoreductase subunit L